MIYRSTVNSETQLAILLRSTPYLNTARILTLYTRTLGLLSAYTRKTSAHTDPFHLAEWILKPSKTELYTVSDVHLLDPLTALRSTHAHLTFAGALANTLLQSQLPGKPSPLLFDLTLHYLRALPTFPQPATLLASYRLKLLLHEGHLSADELTPDPLPLLATTRSLTPLRPLTLSPPLLRQIEHLFLSRIA